MKRCVARWTIPTAVVVAAVFVGSTDQSAAQQPRPGAGRLELEPLGKTHEAIFPYFEGWYRNEDGTATILLGYYNRNVDQTLDVPIGPDNRIEPGGPDRGQPTHFMPRRHWGVFAITVPKEFGTERITWTLTANNLTNSTTVWLNPKYFVEPFRNLANGNTPPSVRLAENGPAFQGPPRTIAQTLEAVTSSPLALTLWASDQPPTYDATTNRFLTLEEVAAKQAKSATDSGAGSSASGGGGSGRSAGAGRGDAPVPIAVINDQVISATADGRGATAAANPNRGGPPADVTIVWSKYRGPGSVSFAQARVPVQLKGDFRSFQKAETTATFSAPGEYMLRAVANDSSGDGGGGDQCCWTTALVRVNVK
jgi:hypothetical protein